MLYKFFSEYYYTFKIINIYLNPYHIPDNSEHIKINASTLCTYSNTCLSER